ncbi:unnamed protein product [Parnassius apollo]|uniref:(apollo) hypothetical protein n=1 Tax=Parnassius apollo TaxID=110799 RepID=A0A8S3WIV7_PARAO|nr:unnamed protein product [Parnassius apollo]
MSSKNCCVPGCMDSGKPMTNIQLHSHKENEVVLARKEIKQLSKVVTVASNMGYLAEKGILPKECEETAEVLLFFDKVSLVCCICHNLSTPRDPSADARIGNLAPKVKDYHSSPRVYWCTKFRSISEYVMEDSQIQRWLHELETDDDEVIESEDDEVQTEPDLQALVHESELRESEDTRLSASDETSDSDDYPLSQLATRRRGSVYKSTNGTIWQKDVPPATRIRPHNIRIRPPGPKGDAARNAKYPVSCFELFFTQDILEILNLKIMSKKTKKIISTRQLEAIVDNMSDLSDLDSDDDAYYQTAPAVQQMI